MLGCLATTLVVWRRPRCRAAVNKHFYNFAIKIIKCGTIGHLVGGGIISSRKRDLFVIPLDLLTLIQTSPGTNSMPKNVLSSAGTSPTFWTRGLASLDSRVPVDSRVQQRTFSAFYGNSTGIPQLRKKERKKSLDPRVLGLASPSSQLYSAQCSGLGRLCKSCPYKRFSPHKSEKLPNTD